jgi:hypothetical protein
MCAEWYERRPVVDDVTTSETTSEASLLEQLDQLEVIEAEELQEGVAFHAFRFFTP